MKKSLIVVLLALHSTPCFSWDGNELQKFCEDEKESSTYYQNNAYCNVYLASASGALDNAHVICIDGHKHGQVRNVIENYIRDNPEHLHYNADVLVKNAHLPSTFAC